MSFSTEIKKELCNHFGNGRHCCIAEIAAIINTCGTSASPEMINIHTENAFVAKKFFKLIKTTFNVTCGISVKTGKQFRKNRVYNVYIREPEDVKRILSAAGFLESSTKRINPLVVKSACCKRAYIRGAFISGGSLNNPEKNYHLEISCTSASISRELNELILFFNIKARTILRKHTNVVYLKDGEGIVSLLNVMEAHTSLMNLENVRILKDMRNSVNRIVNCETANINKTVSAAVKQIEDIEYISQTKGLGYLSSQYEEVARLRLKFPEASLKDLGSMLTPPVGKSGVNHRLRKICQIAETLRG